MRGGAWRTRTVVSVLVVALVSVIGVAAAYGAEGQPDGSFASGGTFRHQFGFGGYQPLSLAFAEAVQSNGDIVLAGESGDGGGSFDLLVVRLTPSGALDPTFGSGGEVDINLPQPSPGRDSSAYSVAIQGDGRIVVAGDVYVGYQEAAIVRLMPNGSLDSSFGSGGIAEVANLTARGIALTPNGNLVVGGWWQDANTTRAFALAELTPSGATQSSFANDGILVEQLDASSNPQSDGQGVAVDGAGRIYAIANANGAGRLLRFTPSGSPDGSFGSGGSVALSSDGEALALESNGTPLSVGSRRTAAGSPALVVEHLLGTGQPDPAFGNGGVATVAGSVGGGSDERADSIAVEPDGGILAASSQNPYGQGPTSLWLVSHSGALESGFGSGGETTLPGDFTALASQVDDKPIIAGGAPSGQQVLFTVDRLLGPTGASNSTGTPTSGNRPGGGQRAPLRLRSISCTHPPRQAHRVRRCVVRFLARARTRLTATITGRARIRSRTTRTVRRGRGAITLWLKLPRPGAYHLTLALRTARHTPFLTRHITVRWNRVH